MIKRFIPERTPEELTERLKLLKQRSRSRPMPTLAIWNLRSSKAILFAASTILVLGLAVTAIELAAHHQGAVSFASEIKDQAGFTLFVPKSLPDGVFFQPKSAKVVQGIMSYSLKSIHGQVTVTEQAVPPHLPDFNSMGLKGSQVPAGTAYSGSSSGRPVMIIVSSTTLIIVNADNKVPSDIVSQLSRAMVSLKN
jgi:hypothetical protein